jgi:hypothetical protein
MFIRIGRPHRCACDWPDAGRRSVLTMEILRPWLG